MKNDNDNEAIARATGVLADPEKEKAEAKKLGFLLGGIVGGMHVVAALGGLWL